MESKLIDRIAPLCQQLCKTVESSPKKGSIVSGQREAIFQIATKIANLAKPTDSIFTDVVVNLAEINALRLFLKWDAFRAIPLEGPISFTDLAQKLDAQVPLIARLARMLASTGVLLFAGPDHIEHSPRSRLLATDEGSDASCRFTVFNDFPEPSLTPEFFEEYGRNEPVSKTHTPYAFASGKPDQTVWEVIDKDAESRAIFLATMKKTQESLRVTTPYDYSWVALENSKTGGRILLVDVGGAGGHTLKGILRSSPEIPREQCILQDRLEVIEEKKGKNDEELLGVQLMSVDFHREQPVKGAAAYILRRCLHDYGDDECVGILELLSQAMAADSRLLIIESVLTQATPAFCYGVDLTMMTISGKERTREDWEKLVSRSALRINRLLPGSGTALGVIECFKS
ncbi:O-methyltransferase [Xylariaceae sp. AK1471]|nr:O-methyltransferase [Xylariaceae sp. AK1471]